MKIAIPDDYQDVVKNARLLSDETLCPARQHQSSGSEDHLLAFAVGDRTHVANPEALKRA